MKVARKSVKIYHNQSFLLSNFECLEISTYFDSFQECGKQYWNLHETLTMHCKSKTFERQKFIETIHYLVVSSSLDIKFGGFAQQLIFTALDFNNYNLGIYNWSSPLRIPSFLLIWNFDAIQHQLETPTIVKDSTAKAKNSDRKSPNRLKDQSVVQEESE